MDIHKESKNPGSFIFFLCMLSRCSNCFACIYSIYKLHGEVQIVQGVATKCDVCLSIAQRSPMHGSPWIQFFYTICWLCPYKNTGCLLSQSLLYRDCWCFEKSLSNSHNQQYGRDLNWPELTWTDLNWPELRAALGATRKSTDWPELTWTDLNWPELTWTDMNWHELTWTEGSTGRNK